MIHFLMQMVARLVKTGPVVDCAGVRSAVGLLALVIVGCTFESGSGQLPPFENTQTGEPVEGSSGGDTTTGPPASPTSTVTSQGEPDPTNDAGSSGGASISTSSSGDAGEVTGDETSSSSGGGSVDCTIPITLTQTAAEATLFKPMQLGMFQGSQYAFSLSQGAGAVRFSFDVACPSTYRLFGRVRDDNPGIHECCDPDSFDVEGPGGLEHTWFYGCDTTTAGWTWAQVEAGENAASCGEAPGLLVPLSAGTHEFTLRNREPAEGGAHAGISELVLTNDPTYSP